MHNEVAQPWSLLNIAKGMGLILVLSTANNYCLQVHIYIDDIMTMIYYHSIVLKTDILMDLHRSALSDAYASEKPRLY